MSATDTWHAPWPGPWPTWDWRCRICDQPVSDHPSLPRHLIRRWRNR